MYRIYLYKASLLVLGAAMLTLGIVIVCQRELLITPVAVFSGAVLILHGIRNLIDFVTRGGKLAEKRKKAKLITAVWNIALGIVLLTLPELSFTLAAILLGAYLLFNAASKLADFIIAKADRQHGHFTELISFAFYMTFAGMLLANRLRSTAFLIISGVYCILFGAEMLTDFITVMMPQRVKNSLKRNIRISPPVFISTFMPLGTLRYINEYISLNDRLPDFEGGNRNGDMPPDIEIMVHVSNNGSGKVGHLDLYFDGEVISYGNHDWSSHRLFSVFGDGILFTAEKEPYIEFSVTHDRKMIFSYGLRLTPEQRAAVKTEVEKLKSQTVPWKPPFQIAVEEKGADNVKLSDHHDYCSILWNGTHAKFFKFRKGKFKTYSILSTNCVLLTDEILGRAGTDIVCISGISSPGIYYDYLERLYLSQTSMVISKNIYSRLTLRNTKKKGISKNE